MFGKKKPLDAQNDVLEQEVKDGEIEQPFRIASVEPDLKRRFRYLIYAEDREEAVFSVHEDVVVRFRLLKGEWVSSEQAADIRVADKRLTAYSLAIGYLGTKPRTSKEIRRYLERKELPPEVIEHAVQRLQEERLLDDGEYARLFAEQRLRSHLKGSLLIRQELKQRGVAREDTREALDALDPEAELAAAVKAASKKWPYIKGEPRERMHKLAMFLGRRGYPGSIIREAVRAAASESDGIDGDDDGLWLDN